jgi:hypothetical protein
MSSTEMRIGKQLDVKVVLVSESKTPEVLRGVSLNSYTIGDNN